MGNKARIPLGMKIIIALLWIFGFIGILMLLFQVPELAYLHLNLRVLMGAVTAVDSIILLLMGVGLFTMKRRWIDAVIVVSIISIVVFYVLPLRPAIPLETVIIIYLVNERGGISLKRLKHMVPLGLLMLSCGTSSVVDLDIFAPYRELIQYCDQTSEQDCFRATMQLYRYEDAIPTTDFYYLEIGIHCLDRKFSHIIVNACVPNPEAEAIMWKPQSMPGSILSVGLGVATFSIGPPEVVIIQHGTNYNYICWTESVMTPKYDEVFSSDFWVPEGMNFIWTLVAEVKMEDHIFGTLWSDTLTFISGG